MTRDFIKRLEEKLKIGTLRGIHLNALPGRYATRLDLSSLANLQFDLPQRFLRSLLQERNFSFPISFDRVRISELDEDRQKQLNLLAKRLNMLAYENDDNFLEHGIKTFGFGYPLLIKRTKKDPSKSIKAPLLIWNLDIVKSSRKANEWKISREEDFPIYHNGVLTSHLESDEKVQIRSLSSEILEDGIVDESELLEICKDVLSRLNVSGTDNLIAKLDQCPDRATIENLASDIPDILWAGIFGLFRVQKESIIKDLQNLEDQCDSFMFDKLVVEKYQTTSISGVKTDPSQEAIINSLRETNTKIIQGPPGTGKSQSLTAIITNALESGAKCLVVCEKKTALDVIHANLKKVNLDHHSMVIDDVSRDRKAVVDAARAAIDRAHKAVIVAREREYSEMRTRYDEVKQKLNERHQSVLKQIHGDDHWKALIGKYLRARRSSDNALQSINATDYAFEFDEYNKLSAILREGERRFRPIGNLSHPLNPLTPQLFKGAYVVSAERTLHSHLTNLQTRVAQVIKDMNKLSRYPELFKKRSLFVDTVTWIYSLFSKEGAGLRTTRAKIVSAWDSMVRLHQSKSSFPFAFKTAGGLGTFSAMLEVASRYQKELDSLLAGWGSFEEYYEWRSYLLQLDIPSKHIVESLAKHSSDWIASFEAWYFDNVLRKYEPTVGPFLKNDELNEEYYALKQEVRTFQEKRIAQLWHTRLSEALGRYESKRGHVKTLYNNARNKEFSRKNSLRSIIKADFDLFTDFFPVLLVNPSVCCSILPLKEGLFDIVIFDEASQLRLEDTFSSLVRGKYRIVSGDRHQMPPSSYFLGPPISIDSEGDEEPEEEMIEDPRIESLTSLADSESLLRFAEDSGYGYSYLDFHYRSRHPYLIDFSNAAFYGSRLVPMPEQMDYRPIRFMDVGGIYETNGTNPEEGRRVVKILSDQINPKADGLYPSVGIATLNIHQRNLILDLIREEYLTNKEFQEKYQKLVEAGLFVKNLENIQGDERDIIIMSTTFGQRADGTFRQQFGPLLQQHGYKLLNVIITRAKFLFYVVTSIPKKYVESFATELEAKGNTGKGIFYAYLAYARAVEERDEEKRRAIVDRVRSTCSETNQSHNNETVESPFEQEVFDRLKEYIDEDRIMPQQGIGGFRVDFLIRSAEGRPALIIECDGKAYHSSNEAYAYDKFRQEQLETLGFKVYRIWSTNWWNHEEDELKKLLRAIEDAQSASVSVSPEYDLVRPFEAQRTEEIREPHTPYQVSPERALKVGAESKVKLEELVTNEQFYVKLTTMRTMVNLEDGDTRTIHVESPLGMELLNKSVGDRCHLEGLDTYYLILEVINE